MLSSLMQRLSERRAAEFEAEGTADAGFTLIELMVVLLILAILLAIAIPTFLGVTGGANDRAAQSNLNTSLTTAKAAETQNNQSYAGITIADLKKNEPSITFVAGKVTVQGEVSVWVDTNTDTTVSNGIILATYSKSTSRCWYAVDNIAPITNFTGNGLYVAADAAGPPVVNGSAKSAPSSAGTFYGKSGSATTTSCDASNLAPVTDASLPWGNKFPA